MKHLLLTTIAANYGFSSIPWWCYLIVFLLLFGFIKKRLGQTIHKHAIEGNIRAIKKLVNSKGVACLEEKDEEGCSPLSYAAMGGHKEVAEYLIDNNSAVNASDAAGCTPLHAAAMLGHIEIIRLLIARGADVDIMSAEIGSALDCALAHQQNECATYLKDLGVKSSASESIFIAAQTGNIEVVTRHLESGVDVNGKCPLGNTPLAWAVNNGDIKLFDLLLSKNADIGCGFASGATLLDAAILQKENHISDILCKNNADKTCGRCGKIFPYEKVRKLWRIPLIILKLVRMHPGEEAERLYCFRCSSSQNVGTVFLATMFASIVVIIIFALIGG
jgi:ankyrin repeat protein